MNGNSALFIKRPQRAPTPLPLCEHTMRSPPSMNRKRVFPDTESAGVLTFDFPASRAMTYRLSFISPPVYGVLSQQPGQTTTLMQRYPNCLEVCGGLGGSEGQMGEHSQEDVNIT